ncbi:MAG: hypothetical protein IPM03_02085 [Sulfuritalea sp.]|nr:hypothetical protein [Sulfuritalea sp.]
MKHEDILLKCSCKSEFQDKGRAGRGDWALPAAAKRTRFRGLDMMTVANVFLAFLVVAILSIWPLTKWAIRSLKELEDEAQKWRIGNHD